MSFSYKFIIFSFFFSLIIAILVYFLLPFYEITGAEKALEGLLLLSSISLGFYGASLSVMASVINTNVIKAIMNDKEERKELLVISCFTLLIGFFTVITTIVYQVMLSNNNVNLNYINSIWFFIVVLFLCMKVLFVLVIFMILFNNKDNEEDDSSNAPLVYTPELKNNQS